MIQPHSAETPPPTRALWVGATAGYLLLACAVTWPLPLHLTTHLLGDTAGDLGVYVWSLWVFSHEVVQHGHLPFSTDHLFADAGGVDVALHNYTPIIGVLGMPLLPLLGVVGTFNVLLLASIAASGLGVFGLGRQIGLRDLPAWCAGAVFVASPVLVARQTAHSSLVLAAPLPLFLWCLFRVLESKRQRDAMAVGALVAIATYADAYYGIYCVLMGLVVLTSRYLTLEARQGRGTGARVIARAANAVMALGGVVVASRLLGLTSVGTGSWVLSFRTLYTPMLVLVAALAVRAGLTWRVSAQRTRVPELRALLPHGMAAVATTLVVLLPMLIGVGVGWVSGRLPRTPVYWRSSPRGVDLLSALVPNPNLEWLAPWIRQAFLPPQGDAFPEFVGSCTLVGLALIALAARSGVLSRFWVGFTVFFGTLALGPFMHVAGINTQMIGPWALLRYVPVIGMARSPSRLAVVATLGCALLVGYALQHFWFRPDARRRVRIVTGALLAFELLPVPRTLHSAAVPDAYRFIANDPRQGSVLELPGGVRDGTSSLGDFSPATMFFQTAHERPILGGYLSRVSEQVRDASRRDPVLGTLYTLSEGRSPAPIDDMERAVARERFLSRTCLAFVVVDLMRATPELRMFARDTLRLERVFADPRYEVLVPVDPPACLAPHQPERHRVAFSGGGQSQ